MDLPNAHFFVKEALDRILFKYENLEEEVKTLRAVLKELHKNGCDPTPEPPAEIVEMTNKISINIKEEEENTEIMTDLNLSNKWAGGKYKIKDNREWDNEKRLKMINKKVRKVCIDNKYHNVKETDWNWVISDNKVWILIDISICIL